MTLKMITAEMLEAKGACKDQVVVFRQLWPDGVVPSLGTCEKAQEAGLDLTWFVDHMLSASAWAAYQAARAPALAAYQAALASALCEAMGEGDEE